MIDISRPSSTRSRGVITLNRGDSFNLSTGSVIHNDTTVPSNRPVASVPPAGTILASMLRRNHLDALALFFRNNTR